MIHYPLQIRTVTIVRLGGEVVGQVNSGVNILAQIVKLFPDKFRNFSIFPYKTFLMTLFIETFPR